MTRFRIPNHSAGLYSDPIVHLAELEFEVVDKTEWDYLIETPDGWEYVYGKGDTNYIWNPSSSKTLSIYHSSSSGTTIVSLKELPVLQPVIYEKPIW